MIHKISQRQSIPECCSLKLVAIGEASFFVKNYTYIGITQSFGKSTNVK